MLLRELAITAALLFFASAALAEELPTPASLEPAVRFWTRVYTEVDSHSGLIHDAENLGVVYQTVHFPEDLNYRGRDQRTEQAKREIRAILLELANGKRDGVSGDEERVLAQWPANVSDATLSQAADNVRFQAGLCDRFRAGLVRSGMWRPFVERALAERGVPPQLVALPHVESSYNPKAYSRVGAAGMWQFMRSTGRLFLRIDNVVDERLDPYVSSEAAARLLARNRDLTGTWPLAITAYNHGVGGMQRASRTLGTTDIGEIARRYRSPSFGFASRNFYASFLAASRIDREPTRYFGAITLEAPTQYTEIHLPWYTPASALARALGVELSVLQEHNPALRPAVWTGGKHLPRDYALRLPQNAITRPVDEVLASVPASSRLAEQYRDRFHKVRRGETISKIARSYGVRETDLAAANNLDARSHRRLRVGQVLVLPDRGARARTVEVAVRGVEPRDVDVADVGVATAKPERTASESYRVRRGDTLALIAKRYGTTESDLVRINSLRNRHKLSIGQRLRVPTSEPVEVASAESAVPDIAPEGTAKPEASTAETAATTPAQTASATATAPSPQADTQRAPTPATAPVPVPMPQPTVTSTSAPAVVPPRAPAPAPEPPAAVALATAPPPAPAVPAPTAPAAAEPAAASNEGASRPDPSDYSVHGDRVTVEPDETLGHFADWLEVRAADLRKLNKIRYGKPVVIGQQLKLDFSHVSPDEFEQRRLEYHQSMQDEFFEAFQVTGTEQHQLEAGESLWYLAQRKYRVPVWLLRQYNPDLDFAALTPGAPLIVPVVEPRGPAAVETPDQS